MATRRNDSGVRYIISLDYGTTYTVGATAWSAAWTLSKRGEPINVVRNWSQSEIADKVPSAYTYSSNPGTQWGGDIGPGAVILKWTKMQLEPPPLLDALQQLRLSLENATQAEIGPRKIVQRPIAGHDLRAPWETMTSYLVEVAKMVRQDIVRVKDELTLSHSPIDLIITHPGVWHPRAKNFIFRAAYEAFGAAFPEFETGPGCTLRLVTEPEACAQYTMQWALNEGAGALRRGQCFVVVDAGGGTVDAVSYRVLELAPNFRVERVTHPSTKLCGSNHVDRCFLETLPTRLGPVEYRKYLDLGGGGAYGFQRPAERILLDRFTPIKHAFAGRNDLGEEPPEDVVELPETICERDNGNGGIRNGYMDMTCTDMEEVFEYSVTGTVDLIDQQLSQIAAKRFRVKTIFLSGGFARSEYLFKCVRERARGGSYDLVRGKDCWTAVVRGAILMGLGVDMQKPPPSIPCPFHIGVVAAERFVAYEHRRSQSYVDSFDKERRARDNIDWVVAKGDLIDPDEGIRTTLRLVRKTNPTGNKTGSVVIVTSRHGEMQQEPAKLKDKVSTREWILWYDLDRIPPGADGIYQSVNDETTGAQYHRVEMQLDISVDQVGARIELTCGKTESTGTRADGFFQGFPLAHDTIPLTG